MDVPIYPFRLASEQKEHIESIIKFVGGSFIHTNKNLLKANDHIKKIDRNFLKELGLHFESKRDSLEATMSGRTEAQMKNVHNGKEKVCSYLKLCSWFVVTSSLNAMNKLEPPIESGFSSSYSYSHLYL